MVSWYILFMVDQFLWRRDIKLEKFNINRVDDQEALDVKSNDTLHLEAIKDKE